MRGKVSVHLAIAATRDNFWATRTERTRSVSASPYQPADGYETFFRVFDSPLMRDVRRDGYGEDIGQHSWVSADELRGDIPHLLLRPDSHLLDLGCGPCGPLTFVVASVGCRGTGLERSSSAVQVGRERGATLGLRDSLSLQVFDLNGPLPFPDRSFDAAMSLDVVLHLPDRQSFFREVARVLVPGGRFLFTDAGVVSGALSSDELRRRAVHGYTQFVAAGWNEDRLAAAGLRLITTEDRTAGVERVAAGRLSSLRMHRAELAAVLGPAEVEAQEEYLDTVLEVSRRRALSRVMYLAERPTSPEP
ncbi:MAG: methyltransferase domain-containing protein [Gemmatimonadaceae bacterium]